MKKTDLTLRYAVIQTFFWMCFAPILAYVSLYLLDCGFTSSTIGLLIAVAGVISALLQPLITSYADRPGSLSLKTLNLLVGGITALVSAALLPFRSSPALTLLCFGAAIALLQVSTPLVNALGMNALNCGCNLNYGLAKGAGSLGYAVSAALLGTLAEKFGAPAVPLSCLAFYACFLCALLLFPKQPTAAAAGMGAGKPAGSRGFFRKYPRFTVVIVGCVLLFVSHTVLNSFTLQILETKGGDSSDMGLAMALAAVAELPTAFCFSLLMKKAGSHFWFRISGIFFMLKTLLTLLCTNLLGFFAVQPLQMLAWALISVSSVYYINAIMAPEDAVKGQGAYTTAYTLGCVIGAVIGGRVIDSLGVPAMLVFGTVCAGVGAVLMLVFADKSDDRAVGK